MSSDPRPADESAKTYTEVADAPASWPVHRSEQRFRSAKVGMRTDWVEVPGTNGEGTTVAARDFMEHMGAAGVVALDEQNRVLVQRQYRHATQHTLWELPAGVIDGDGEGPLATAQRELLEEAGLRAEHWYWLPDFFPSPGFSDERIHLFLARGLARVPQEEIGFEREHEETDLAAEWLPLQEAVRAVMDGRLHNGATVIGILATCAAVRDGLFSTLTELG